MIQNRDVALTHCRGEISPLLPPLRATTVASRVVRAVETRRERIVVPYALKWLPPLLSLQPLGVWKVCKSLWAGVPS